MLARKLSAAALQKAASAMRLPVVLTERRERLARAAALAAHQRNVPAQQLIVVQLSQPAVRHRVHRCRCRWLKFVRRLSGHRAVHGGLMAQQTLLAAEYLAAL